MNITIKNGEKIADIQAAFNHLFPYLKLEFYNSLPGKTIAAYDSAISRDLHLSSLVKLLEWDDICIEFSEMTTVKELEKNIWRQTGIHAKVFRKFGKAWLPVMLTSNWTLKLQNEEGAVIANLSG